MCVSTLCAFCMKGLAIPSIVLARCWSKWSMPAGWVKRVDGAFISTKDGVFMEPRCTLSFKTSWDRGDPLCGTALQLDWFQPFCVSHQQRRQAAVRRTRLPTRQIHPVLPVHHQPPKRPDIPPQRIYYPRFRRMSDGTVG